MKLKNRLRSSVFMGRLTVLALLASFAAGCASINSVSVSSIPANRSQEVTAEASRWIIFFFNFDNDYVDDVSRELSQKCQNGRISGILTKDEVYNYFIGLVMKRSVVATGYCEKHNVAGMAVPAKAKQRRMINSVESGDPASEGPSTTEQAQ